MKHVKLFLALLLLAAFAAVPAAHALTGQLGGPVVARFDYLNSSGYLSAVELVVKDSNGLSYSVWCHRWEGNLPQCSGVNVNDKVQVSGEMTSYTDMEATSITIAGF